MKPGQKYPSLEALVKDLARELRAQFPRYREGATGGAFTLAVDPRDRTRAILSFRHDDTGAVTYFFIEGNQVVRREELWLEASWLP